MKKKKLSSSERVAKVTKDYLDRCILSDFLKELNQIVDNGTTYVSIPTPKGWKCKRKGCRTDYKHTHTTYDCLKKKA